MDDGNNAVAMAVVDAVATRQCTVPEGARLLGISERAEELARERGWRLL